MVYYLELVDDSSAKFWRLELDGAAFFVTFGRIGTQGQTQRKTFGSEAQAQAEADKLLASKLKKGYGHATEPETQQPAAAAKVERTLDPTSDAGPPPVADDGKAQPWRSTDPEFDLERLADPVLRDEASDDTDSASSDDVQPPQATALSAGPAPTPTVRQVLAMGDTYERPEWIFARLLGDGKLDYAKVLWTHHIALEATPESQAATLTRALHRALKEYNFADHTWELVAWLLETGAEFEPWDPQQSLTPDGDDGDDDDDDDKDDIGVGPFDNHIANWFYQEYITDPRPERTAELVDTYLRQVFDQAWDALAETLTDYAHYVRTGEVRGDRRAKDFSYRPEAGVIERSFIGLEIWPGHGNWVRLFLFGSDREAACYAHLPPLASNTKRHMSQYAHLLVPKLDALAASGAFDGLFEWGGFYLKIEDTPHLVTTIRTAPDAAERFEAELTRLEATTAWEDEVEDCITASLGLLHGVFGPPDPDRAAALLRRFLYGCTEWQVDLRLWQFLADYADSSPRLRYELARRALANGDFEGAKSAAQRALLDGHAPAAELLAEIGAALSARKALARGARVEPAEGFDLTAAKRLWADASFDQVFNEDDLYLRTDEVVLRARENGHIYLRFLVESESAYGTVLDFANRLLERGYARLSGGAAGFAWHVRFVSRPEFIAELKGAKSLLGEPYPRSAAHALFARAVQYPELREKVRGYAERALDRFTVYLDLDEESTTVPGTFAAAALAFCGKEYWPVVRRYAHVADDEHTYLLGSLVKPLLKHYGNDPELAGVLYDIALHGGADETLKLPKDLLWTSDFMAELLAQVRQGDTGAAPADDFYLAAEKLYGTSAPAVLKKVKSLANSTRSDVERQVYVDFHNTYLSGGQNWSQDSDALARQQPLDLTPVVTSDAAVLDHQDVVVLLAEAIAAGWGEAAEDFSDEKVTFHSPIAITDPDRFAYIKQQWERIGADYRRDPSIQDAHVFYGPMVMRSGEWALNSDQFPYTCAVVIHGAKGRKPMVLFGEYDVTGLAAACVRRPPKSEAEALALSEPYLIRPAAPRPSSGEWRDADRYLDDPLVLGNVFSNLYAAQTVRALRATTLDAGEIVYQCSRVILAYYAELLGDPALMAEVAGELMQLAPEQADYWSGKLEAARGLVR